MEGFIVDSDIYAYYNGIGERDSAKASEHLRTPTDKEYGKL